VPKIKYSFGRSRRLRPQTTL